MRMKRGRSVRHGSGGILARKVVNQRRGEVQCSTCPSSCRSPHVLRVCG